MFDKQFPASNERVQPKSTSADGCKRSIFRSLEAKQDSAYLGKWTLVRLSSSEARLKFLANSLELTLSLGHELPNQKSGHCSIRKATLKTFAGSGSDNNVLKLAHHLLHKEWPAVRISNHFRSTESLEADLAVFCSSVSDAARFMLDIDEIEGDHCYTNVDQDFKVTVEFHSMKLICSFMIVVDFSHGFKAAKHGGVTLIPGISDGYMVSDNTVDSLSKSPASGWTYLGQLIKKFDQFKSEAEKLQ